MSAVIKINDEDIVPIDASEVLSDSRFHPEIKVIRTTDLPRHKALRIVVANPKLGSEADDNPKKTEYASSMNDITREEFNAKLETIETKMDARVDSMTAKIDGFLAAQNERDKRLDLLLAQISKDSSDAKSSISSMKSTLIVTAISTVLAIVIGVASFNTSLTSNMISAFQLGATQANRSAGGAIEQPSPPATSSQPSVPAPVPVPAPSNNQ